MKQDERFRQVDWEMLETYLPEKFLIKSDAEPDTTVQHDIVLLNNSNNEQRQNIRNQLIIRFLTAMSIDYEKQWYLGMIRRQTLYILIKSVEKAKEKCSLELHWQLLVKNFRLSFFLFNLIKFNRFAFAHRWINNRLFDHIILTIDLALGKYNFILQYILYLVMFEVFIRLKFARIRFDFFFLNSPILMKI
jgi:hypothetical protein